MTTEQKIKIVKAASETEIGRKILAQVALNIMCCNSLKEEQKNEKST